MVRMFEESMPFWAKRISKKTTTTAAEGAKVGANFFLSISKNVKMWRKP